MNLTREIIEKLQKSNRYDLIVIAYINESVYAGCLPNGNIVDRRFYPEAIPVQKNECKNCWNDNLDKEYKIINLSEGFYCTSCLWYDEDRKELRLHKHYH